MRAGLRLGHAVGARVLWWLWSGQLSTHWVDVSVRALVAERCNVRGRRIAACAEKGRAETAKRSGLRVFWQAAESETALCHLSVRWVMAGKRKG